MSNTGQTQFWGLTIQRGPWAETPKDKRNEMTSLGSKTFFGGGVQGAGKIHAGHAGAFSEMNPVSTPNWGTQPQPMPGPSRYAKAEVVSSSAPTQYVRQLPPGRNPLFSREQNLSVRRMAQPTQGGAMSRMGEMRRPSGAPTREMDTEAYHEGYNSDESQQQQEDMELDEFHRDAAVGFGDSVVDYGPSTGFQAVSSKPDGPDPLAMKRAYEQMVEFSSTLASEDFRQNKKRKWGDNPAEVNIENEIEEVFHDAREEQTLYPEEKISMRDLTTLGRRETNRAKPYDRREPRIRPSGPAAQIHGPVPEDLRQVAGVPEEDQTDHWARVHDSPFTEQSQYVSSKGSSVSELERQAHEKRAIELRDRHRSAMTPVDSLLGKRSSEGFQPLGKKRSNTNPTKTSGFKRKAPPTLGGSKNKPRKGTGTVTERGNKNPQEVFEANLANRKPRNLKKGFTKKAGEKVPLSLKELATEKLRASGMKGRESKRQAANGNQQGGPNNFYGHF